MENLNVKDLMYYGESSEFEKKKASSAMAKNRENFRRRILNKYCWGCNHFEGCKRIACRRFSGEKLKEITELIDKLSK